LFGGGYHAVDVKVARRARSGRQTDSRITLYTGNTYFRYPTLQWPGTFRPFQDYQSHLDVIAIYTLNETSHSRIDDFELIVQEPWRIASRQRSSTTREYLGAVMSIADLRAGRGEFKTPDEFYLFWRRYQFRIGRAVQQQLDKLLRAQQKRP
jgi:Restriction endonuclease EcoRV